MVVIMDVEYITDKEAAKRYGYSISWFQRARHTKTSPPYVKLRGKIYYPLQEINRWFKEKMKLIY